MPRLTIICPAFLLFTMIAGGCNRQASIEDQNPGPADIPILLAFWDFQEPEPEGEDRISVGAYEYALKEMNGSIKRVNAGIFGPYSADLEWGQWFRAERHAVSGLNLHGDDQQVTMVAWIKRESELVWQYIAGMWNEGDERFMGQAMGTGDRAPARQYALLISGAWQSDYTTYERTRARHQAHGCLTLWGCYAGSSFCF